MSPARKAASTSPCFRPSRAISLRRAQLSTRTIRRDRDALTRAVSALFDEMVNGTFDVEAGLGRFFRSCGNRPPQTASPPELLEHALKQRKR